MDWEGELDADRPPGQCCTRAGVGVQSSLSVSDTQLRPSRSRTWTKKQTKEFFANNAIKVKQVTRHVLTAHAAAIVVGSLLSNRRVSEIIERATKAREQEAKAEGSDE